VLVEIRCDKIQPMAQPREHLRALLPAFFLAPAICSAADDVSFARMVQQIGSSVESDHAMQTMRSVWETDRWFTFPKFRETAEYLRVPSSSPSVSFRFRDWYGQVIALPCAQGVAPQQFLNFLPLRQGQ
jgi:hypothetical protein